MSPGGVQSPKLLLSSCLFLSLAGAALVLVAPACKTDEPATGRAPTLEERLDEARALLLRGEQHQAFALLRQVEAQLHAAALHAPRDARLHFLLGGTHFYLGEDEPAARELDLALREAPARADYHFLRGVFSRFQGQPASAIASLRSAVQLQPGEPRFWGELGEALLDTHQQAEALDALRTTMARGGRGTRVRNLAAGLLVAQGQLPEALALFEESARLERAGSALAAYDAGQLHQLQGHTEQALEWFERASRAAPEDGPSLAKLVQLSQQLGHLRERDRSRDALFALHQSHKLDSPRYCREQFRAGRYTVRAFEHFELLGDWATRYTFELVEDPRAPVTRWLSLGSYAATNAIAQLHRPPGSGARLFHLDGYDVSGRHGALAFYEQEPAYDEVRARVVAVLNARDGTLFSASAETPQEEQGAPVPGLSGRVRQAVLAVDNPSDEAYARTVLADLQQLAPTAVMGAFRRISLAGDSGTSPVGTRLVLSLANSDKVVVIAPGPGWGNLTTPRSPEDTVNGKGSNADVYYSHDFDPEIPTRLPDGRVVPKRGRPGYISLGHELVHALHMTRGTLGQVVKGKGQSGVNIYRDIEGKQQTETESVEELRTAGLGKYADGPTENALRREHGLLLRGAYQLGSESTTARLP